MHAAPLFFLPDGERPYCALNAEGFAFFLRWWCEELVRALLWGAWQHVLKRDGEAQDRAFARFDRLVLATPCWPCRVSWQHPKENERRFERGDCGPYRASLEILAGAAADEADLWEDWP